MNHPDPRPTLVQFGDWQALYIGGRKALEGHSIPLNDLLDALDVAVTFTEATPDYDAKTSLDGFVPETLEEYPPDALH